MAYLVDEAIAYCLFSFKSAVLPSVYFYFYFFLTNFICCDLSNLLLHNS